MTLPLSHLYPVKAVGLFAAILIIVLMRRRHHPFARFGPGNQITAVRALLASTVAGLIGEPPLPIVVICLSTTATVLDGVDGWLARRTQMASAFGARFDMEVDALLIQVLAILVWLYGKAGPWVIASGLLRYAFVAAGAVWPWMRRPLASTIRGKAICVVQIAGLLLALLPWIGSPMSDAIAGASLAALAYSFLVDTIGLWQSRAGIRDAER